MASPSALAATLPVAAGEASAGAGSRSFRRGWRPFALLLAGGLIAALYLALAITAPDQAFWTPDSGMKYLQTVNLRLAGGRLVDTVPYPAAALDPAARLAPLGGLLPWKPAGPGLFTGAYPLALPLLFRPWLAAFGLRGLLLLPALAGAICCLLAGLLAERCAPGRGWLAALLTAFASPVWFYSQVFWEQTAAVALALGAIYVLPAGGGLRWRRFLAAMVLAVAALALRREMAVLVAGLVLWQAALVIQASRNGPAAARRALPAAGLLGVVSLAAAFAAGQRVAIARGVLAAKLSLLHGAAALSIARHLAGALADALYNSNQAFAAYRQDWRLLVLAAAALAILAGLARGRPKWLLLAASAGLIAWPAAAQALSGEAVRSIHGIILGGPLLLAGVATLQPRRHPQQLLFAGLGAGLVLLQMFTLDNGPTFGLEWGSRLALLAYPLAAAVLATALPIGKPAPKLGPALAAASLLALAVISAGQQVRGIAELRSDTGYLSRWTEALEALPGSAVVTDVWWLPMAVTPAFYQHQFLLVQDQTGAGYLAAQPWLRSQPLLYAGLSGPDGTLPAVLAGSFQAGARRPVAGGPGQAQGVSLWIESIAPLQPA